MVAARAAAISPDGKGRATAAKREGFEDGHALVFAAHSPVPWRLMRELGADRQGH